MSTVPACPLCGDEKRMKRTKLLYGHRVCKKCVNGFANRRQLAFVIDWVTLYLVNFAAAVALMSLAADESGEVALGFEWLLTGFFMTMLVVKDGFSGCSPGKKLMGVQAVDRRTFKPIGFGASALRNLPIFIPLGPLIIAFDLMDGPRIGDGWSKSKVIWTRYVHHPIFAGPPADTGFGPEHVELPPVVDTTNPFQPPQA